MDDISNRGLTPTPTHRLLVTLDVMFAIDDQILTVPEVPIESMEDFLKGRDHPSSEREPDRQ